MDSFVAVWENFLTSSIVLFCNYVCLGEFLEDLFFQIFVSDCCGAIWAMVVHVSLLTDSILGFIPVKRSLVELANVR